EGAPAAIAEIVTVVGPPTGVPAAAVTVNVTVTGVEDVGLTELDGENTQAPPAKTTPSGGENAWAPPTSGAKTQKPPPPAAPPSSSVSPSPQNFPPPLP